MRQLLVTAGVMIENQQFLLAKRLSNGPEGGKWEFPGGKVELGEDPRQGLQRELMEELGIVTRAGRIWEVVAEIKGDLQLILLYFLCEKVQGTPAAIECQQVGWFNPDEVDLLEKPYADQVFWELHRSKLMALAGQG